MLFFPLINVFIFAFFPCPLMTIRELFVIYLTFSFALYENDNCPLPTRSSTETKFLLKKKEETYLITFLF